MSKSAITTASPISGLQAIYMPWEMWSALPEHPRQRPIAERIKRVTKKGTGHLSEDCISHLIVFAVRNPDTGELHKCDGHTRHAVTEAGGLTKPEFVLVVVLDPEQSGYNDDFINLYYVFDGDGPTERAREKLGGLIKDFGWVFESPRLRTAQFSTGFLYAYGGYSMSKDFAGYIKNLKAWEDELFLADQLELPASGAITRTPALAAMFLSFRRYGSDILPFWQDVRDGHGNIGKVREGINKGKTFYEPTGLASFLIGTHPTSTTANRENTKGGRQESETMIRKLLACVDQFRNSDEPFYRKPPGVTSLTKWRVDAENAKRDRLGVARIFDDVDLSARATYKVGDKTCEVSDTDIEWIDHNAPTATDDAEDRVVVVEPSDKPFTDNISASIEELFGRIE